jgi:5-methyltetrahydropteroyltriglutamate--homocysteine methyltransferase
LAHCADYLKQAQDDATLLAIRDQERAGLDIITDGEMRRAAIPIASPLHSTGSMSTIRTALDRSGHPNPVPRVTGKKGPSPASGWGRRCKIPARQHRSHDQDDGAGPFTMSQQAQNDFYKNEEEMALDYAAAVNSEIKDLFAAGADIVQIDEPYMQARPENQKIWTQSAQCRARWRSTGRRRFISVSVMPPSFMCAGGYSRFCPS